MWGINIKVNGFFNIMEEKWLNNFVMIGSGDAYKWAFEGGISVIILY